MTANVLAMSGLCCRRIELRALRIPPASPYKLVFEPVEGFDLEADIARVRRVQRFVDGRAVLRLDGNQAFTRAEALRCARSLDAQGIELLEQPCAAREIDNAGDMNGFLKPRTALFENPMTVEGGAMILPPGGMPAIDRGTLDALTTRTQAFGGP